MRKRTIKSWVDSLPEEAVGIRIRLGSGRNQPTLSIIALENSGFNDQDDAGIIFCKEGERADLIETLALDAGWKIEEPTLRLHAISRSGKPLASWQLTDRGTREKTNMGSDYSIGALTDGLLSMANQLTKTIDILTESLAHSESSRAHMFEALLEAREDQLTSETHAILAAMDGEPEPPDPLKMQAVQAFQTVAQSLAGGAPGVADFTAEDVRKKAESDIWFKSDLASEWSKMSQNTSSNSSPGQSNDTPGQPGPDLKSETD